MSLNKARFVVRGTQYVITTTDSETYVSSLAERLEKDIKEVLEASPSASVMAATVISAMGYLDELEKKSVALDNMREQIKEYLQEAAKAKTTAEEAVKQAKLLHANTNAPQEPRVLNLSVNAQAQNEAANALTPLNSNENNDIFDNVDEDNI